MFKLKEVFNGISLEKIYEGTKGIGYKLGILTKEHENCYSERKKVKRLVDPPIFYHKRNRLIF